ncbi:MAG: energy-coupling factor transporter transmembrane component T family protein [Promethearchaeota archaeon]
MNTSLPFRHNNEKTILSGIHPVIRLILPFFFVIPFLLIDDIYLIIVFILITFLICLVAKLKLIRILSRVTSILPFILLITIFIPLYIGNTTVFRINFFGIPVNLYKEGINRAILLFARIFAAIFIFMSFYSSLTYSEFIEALTSLKLPSLLVGSFIIMLHYIPIFASSNKKILEAQELRGKKITNYWEKLKAHAYIMGKSLVANMERSEKIYESLKMRGFTGKMTFAKRKLKIYDFFTLILFTFITISILFVLDLELIFEELFTLCLL